MNILEHTDIPIKLNGTFGTKIKRKEWGNIIEKHECNNNISEEKTYFKYMVPQSQ